MLEYGDVVWAPTAIVKVNRIEGIQRWFLKRIGKEMEVDLNEYLILKEFLALLVAMNSR